MWEIIMVPVEQGFVVYVTDGKTRSLIGRVAWSRSKSVNPFRTFKSQLRKVLARAEAEMNELNGGRGE